MMQSVPKDHPDNEYQTDLARLRASHEQFCEASCLSGRAAGMYWARKRGEYGDLRRVAKLDEALEQREDVDMQQLAEAIEGDCVSGRDIDELAERLFDHVDPHPDEIRGFIEGVAEVLADV
ncbi:hypothetical protein ISI02_24590 [Burkholderia pseudomallei]|nr:hypothetical protein [Burkholderia pseudomallei]